MRLKLRKRIGKSYKSRGKPDEKSTTIHVWDINLLAKINNRHRIWAFISGKMGFGPVVSRRLSRILLMLEAGLITKSQYGAYHFHDEPKAPVVREMRVEIGRGGVLLTKLPQLSTPPTMPDFSKVFEGK